MFAVVPNEPACKIPPEPVMIGKFAVVPIRPPLVIFPCVCDVGVLESDNHESLPCANVPAVVPNEPTVIKPAVVVIKGKVAVEPILPSFVIFP